jgi:hypothetical protein
MQSMRRRLVVSLAAVLLIAVGCGSAPASPAGSGSPAGGSATPGAGSAAPSLPVASSDPTAAAPTALAPPTAPPTTLDAAVYALVADSSGAAPNPGSTVRLLFGPGGRAALLAATDTDALSHHGTWTFAGGTATLDFAAIDFPVHARFDLDLTAATVTMPFQVFDTATGSSTWRQDPLGVIDLAQAVLTAAAADPDIPEPAAHAVVDEVYATVMASVTRWGTAQSPGPAGDIALAASTPAPAPPKITGVTKLGNGLRVEFEGAPAVDVPLYNWAADPASTAPLVRGPIASDPRVRLDPANPGDASADPASRRAVLIAPFRSGRYYGNIWANLVPNRAAAFLSFNTGTHDPSKGFDWEGIAAKLGSRGFSVTQLDDRQASLMAIMTALGVGGGGAPGYLVFNTHGMSDGSLSTGIDLGRTEDAVAVREAWFKELGALGLAYTDLLTFEGGTAESPKTVGLMALPRDNAVGRSDYFLSLEPAFWRWLASKGITFNRSLVYVAACNTDASADLREAIHAKAYYAWTLPVNPMLAGAVANYLADELVRPTRSAEEVFYDIFRVVSTRSEIYDYDANFRQAIPAAIRRGVAFLDFFHGWGYDGSAMVPYATTGWLDRTMNPGSVWWLVFAARWDQHAPDGAAKLVDCFAKYWTDGKGAGLADAFCNAASPGGAPSADEVGYATYLLTGRQLMPYGKTPVPRLTLHDGG